MSKKMWHGMWKTHFCTSPGESRYLTCSASSQNNKFLSPALFCRNFRKRPIPDLEKSIANSVLVQWVELDVEGLMEGVTEWDFLNGGLNTPILPTSELILLADDARLLLKVEGQWNFRSNASSISGVCMACFSKMQLLVPCINTFGSANPIILPANVVVLPNEVSCLSTLFPSLLSSDIECCLCSHQGSDIDAFLCLSREFFRSLWTKGLAELVSSLRSLYSEKRSLLRKRGRRCSITHCKHWCGSRAYMEKFWDITLAINKIIQYTCSKEASIT